MPHLIAIASFLLLAGLTWASSSAVTLDLCGHADRRPHMTRQPGAYIIWGAFRLSGFGLFLKSKIHSQHTKRHHVIQPVSTAVTRATHSLDN
ncbi:MAG: hypothetical protein L0228_12510, partial [Planctomycetes bacterium]|nr:hypothetical protein [Planctomycetota bacterium]